MDFSLIDWGDIWQATWETLAMTGFSLLFTILLGLPLGILLFITGKRQLLEQRGIYRVLSLIVNVLRSVPFLILLIVMIPVTVILVGTSLGVQGAIPPLVLGTAPFFARLVKTSCVKSTAAWSKLARQWAPTSARSFRRPAAGSPARPDRRHHRHRDRLDVVCRHVRRDRRRRPGRPGDPLRLPALPDRSHGHHRAVLVVLVQVLQFPATGWCSISRVNNFVLSKISKQDSTYMTVH